MKKRYLILGFCLLSMSLLFVSVGCTKESPSGKEPPVSSEALSPTPTARPTRAVFTEKDVRREDKDNKIKREDVEIISPGDKQEDVVRWLGFPIDVGFINGYGYVAEYSCTNGEYVHVVYEWKESEEGESCYVVDLISIVGWLHDFED